MEYSKRNGLAVYKNGRRFHYQNGLRHRIDGPAFERPDGYQAWYKDGRLHREGGPAVIRPDGWLEWWLNGLFVRREKTKVEDSENKIAQENLLK